VGPGTVAPMTEHETAALLAAGLPHRQAMAALDRLGMSDTRHAQVVGHLIDRPDVEAAYPVLVHRLRRLRDARRRARRAA
jgi:hypothetical protein